MVWGSAGDNVYGFTGHASGTYDYFDGRGGSDTADFSLCGTAVWVGLDYAGIEAWSWETAANQQIADLDDVENIVGSAFNDVLIGDGGANVIAGGYGNDQLTGAAGPDAFVFNKALNAATNVDLVTDFSVADDVIHLDRAVFSSLKPGVLAQGAFVVGSAAGDANDHIVYNSATGRSSTTPMATERTPPSSSPNSGRASRSPAAISWSSEDALCRRPTAELFSTRPALRR